MRVLWTRISPRVGRQMFVSEIYMLINQMRGGCVFKLCDQHYSIATSIRLKLWQFHEHDTVLYKSLLIQRFYMSQFNDALLPPCLSCINLSSVYTRDCLIFPRWTLALRVMAGGGTFTARPSLTQNPYRSFGFCQIDSRYSRNTQMRCKSTVSARSMHNVFGQHIVCI